MRYSVICYTYHMSLFSPQKDSDVFLVFDIGSGSVGGALILTSATHTPTLLYSFRSEIPFQEEATGLRLLSLMLRALSQVVLAIVHEGFEVAGFGSHRPRIQEALISLSAPWVISKTFFLRLRNKEPMLITENVFTGLLQESEKNAESEDKDIPKGSVQIEQKLIKSVLNGYETSLPYGKLAYEAEFAVLGGFSVPRVTEKITDTITQLLHAKHLTFHSFSLIAFAMLRELYPAEENFLFADISGEQTEISVAKKGVLVETVTFPFGKNHLIRSLKKDTNIPAGGASALFKLYAEDAGTGKLFERTKKLLDTAGKDWQTRFMKTLSDFSGEVFLPKTLFLTADDDVLPIFKKAIASGDVSSFTISSSPFQIIAVQGGTLSPLIRTGTSYSHDPFIEMVSAFANRVRR